MITVKLGKCVSIKFHKECFDGICVSKKQHYAGDCFMDFSFDLIASGNTEKQLVQNLLDLGYVAPSKVGELARMATEEILKEFGRYLFWNN